MLELYRMIRRGFLAALIVCILVGTSFAAVEISIDSLTLQGGGTEVYQDTSPSFVMMIRNSGNSTARVTSPIPEGFISCTVDGEIVFSSLAIVELIINPRTINQFPIAISNRATQTLGNKTLSCRLSSYDSWIIVGPSLSVPFTVIVRKGGRFDDTLEQVRDPLKNHIDGPVAELGQGGVKSFIYSLIDKIAVPGAVLFGVLFAVLALYKIMFSDEENKLASIGGLITRGVVGVIIIMSAKFIGGVMYNGILGTGEISNLNAVEIVGKLYNLVLRPLLKLGFYIMIGVLFILLLIRVFSFVTSTSEEVKKKSGQIIISSVVGLFVMLGAKQLVEGVYGKEELIRNSAAVTVTQIGSSFLSDANIPLIYGIIQRIMGLSGFILLAIIIFQTYQLLINPISADNRSRIGKTLLYSLIGMLVIGAGYLIVNVLLVN